MLGAFEATREAVAEAVERDLERVLPAAGPGPESQLFAAMRYAVLEGGKRLRPFLVCASADIFGVPRERSVRVGTAVELVHCYSLVHDDLPSMDDDRLRRGRPTVHVAFDEATAILAGDALLTLAFEALSREEATPDPMARLELLRGLARAAGPRGMVGGQMIDLWAETRALDEAGIVRLQRMKTGEMIAFAGEAGAILGHGGSEARHALRMYAHDLGLAYQITDDLLDVRGREADLGKTAGKDAVRGKATFVSLLGERAAADRAAMLARQSVAHLEHFGREADALRGLAEFVISRRS